MRSLMAARLVLLDSDPIRREALAAALTGLGTFEIVSIATVAEVANLSVSPPDIFVIEGPSLAANDEATSISSNPFSTSGIPTILLLPDATNEQRRIALRAGYSIVLGAPVAPRLLYRRIAHLLQNARRAKRRAQLSAQESRRSPLTEFSPVELSVRTKVPAH